MTYGWALIVLLGAISILYYIGAFYGSEYIPRHCNLQPGLSCVSYAISGNSSGVVVAFTGKNELGHDIGFEANAASVTAENLGLAGRHNYTGNCSPSIVEKGMTYTCIVTIPFSDRIPAFGKMQRTQISVLYKNCESNPNYRVTKNCSASLTSNYSLRGELVSQFEPYVPISVCGNGECDDNLGETATSCPEDCLPVPFTIVLDASPSSIPANGSSTAVITAAVYDQFGNPYPGVTVFFAKNSSNGSLSANSNITNSEGVATTTFTSGTFPETILINASLNSSFYNEVTIELTQPSVVPITTCQTINTPGNYYLADNISFSGSICCIDIRADGVVFDGARHTITGDGSSGNIGVCTTGRNNIQVKNLTINKTEIGIRFENTNNSLISSNNLLNATGTYPTAGGIQLLNSSYNNITGNNATSNVYGIFLSNQSRYNNIVSNNVSSSTLNGIYLEIGSNNNNIKNNYANSNGYGIYLDGSSNNTIMNNDASSNSNYGMEFYNSSNNSIINNNVNSNPYCIVLEVYSNNNTLIGNNASNSAGISGWGIWLRLSSNNTIRSNNVSLDAVGIRLQQSLYNTITSNNVSSNTQYGIYISQSSYNTITGNNASSNADGIYISQSSNNNNLTNNNANSNVHGIYLSQSSNNNNLTSNNASSNSNDGIHLSSSSNNTIMNNDASLNTEYGICLYSSPNNAITSNNASSDVHGIYLDQSSYNTLTGNNASSNTQYGIYISQSSNNNNLTNNNANSNVHGIYLYQSSYNTLTGNNASSNSYYGIYISESSFNNNLTNNNVSSNTQHGIYILLSSYNTLTSNTVRLNGQHGILLYSSSNNIVFDDNIVCGNNQSGGNYYDLYCSGSTSSGDSIFDTNSGCTVTQSGTC